jgi:uncharacterized protein (UPF0548 family)
MIEVVVLEANEAVVFEVRTHHRIAVVFFNYCAVILRERGGGILRRSVGMVFGG